jgi:phage terminase large subunit-like protein
VWQGSPQNAVPLSEVEDWITQAHKTFNYAPVRLDPWQMIGSLQRLREREGVNVEEFFFTAQSVGKLAAVLHRLLRDRMLALPDDQELLDELRSVRLEERTPGVVRLAHDSDRHDDRAVALGLAAHKIIDGRVGPPPRANYVPFDSWDAKRGSLVEELYDDRFGAPMSRDMRL